MLDHIVVVGTACWTRLNHPIRQPNRGPRRANWYRALTVHIARLERSYRAVSAEAVLPDQDQAR
ncbi:hypothetical protein [Kitasatospora azatica]|uniref:hypothetical protein n=1 Tax=Kitasatospora azatica TaxID=58347 RepID=UPI00056B1906|nr:hypothetical protein [Kitasatospora azatica]